MKYEDLSEVMWNSMPEWKKVQMSYESDGACLRTLKETTADRDKWKLEVDNLGCALATSEEERLQIILDRDRWKDLALELGAIVKDYSGY